MSCQTQVTYHSGYEESQTDTSLQFEQSGFLDRTTGMLFKSCFRVVKVHEIMARVIFLAKRILTTIKAVLNLLDSIFDHLFILSF